MLETIDALIWGPALIGLLLGCHLFMTARLGFIQRKLGLALKLSITKDEAATGDISQFQALTTALSATIGTGNIVGVATAILAGGPGAVLWMWLTGVFGMATKYAETLIAGIYRAKDDQGEILGGAMVAWLFAFKKDGKTPLFARLGSISFAAFCTLASFGIGAGVQSNAISSIIVANVPGVPMLAVAVVLVALVALSLFGGVKQIARICEALVPFMAAFYVAGCLIILAINHSYLAQALQLITSSAFSPKAAFGGAVGSGLAAALQFGCARGLFSNESGLGSAPIVASAASSSNPARQALVSMTATFWDTVVICAITGLMLVSTMLAHPEITSQVAAAHGHFSGAALTSLAFQKIPYIGRPVLILGLIMFAYSTILGWSYYGGRCASFLFSTRVSKIYLAAYVAICFVGAIGVNNSVWLASDITNALMVIPNVLLIFATHKLIADKTRYYVWQNNIDELDTAKPYQL